MTGHSSVLDIAWADAELESVTIDYNAVVLSLIETQTDRACDVRCEGYIGYQLLGFWDEVVVESATLVKEHAFLSQCLTAIRGRYPGGLPTTGQPARNEGNWSLLTVRLSDGAELLVAASTFVVVINAVARGQELLTV